MPPRQRALACVALAATLGLASTAAPSQPLSVRSLEIGPSRQSYGIQGSAALSATSLLLATSGPRDLPDPALWSDVALLIEDLDGEAKITPIAISSRGRCHVLRLSPTRALLLTDDGAHLLDDLGGTNRVSFTAVDLQGIYLPGVRLDDDIAVAIAGSDYHRRVVVLSDLGGTVRVTESADFPRADGLIPLGPRSFLLTEPRNRYFASFLRVAEDGSLTGKIDLELRASVGGVVALSSSSFLFAFDEALYDGADDSVYLFTGLGGEIRRSELLTPYFASPRELYRTPGLIRLSATRALLPSPGPDGTLGNDDDRVLVLGDLGGTNEVDAIPTPGLAPVVPQRLRGDRALIGLGAFASATLAALRDIGASNVLGPSSSPLPGLHFYGNDLLAVEPEGALFASGVSGLDPEDDLLEWVSGFGTSPVTEEIPLRRIGTSYFSLQRLGNGRAFKSDLGGLEEPHHIHVFEGLGGLALEAEQISLRFNQAYGASLRATARLYLPEPTDLASSDLTVRIGNAWQTIPASEIRATATGYLYEDRRGRRGFLRRLEYDAVTERLTVKGRGFHTRAATTRPDNLVLSVEGLFFYAAQSLDGTRRGDRILYRSH